MVTVSQRAALLPPPAPLSERYRVPLSEGLSSRRRDRRHASESIAAPSRTLRARDDPYSDTVFD